MHRFFFSLLIIFFPTQLGYHFWPDWAMVLGRRVDYLSPTLFFTDILILFTLGFWIFSRDFPFLQRKSKIQNPKSKQISKFKIQNVIAIAIGALFIGSNIFFAESRQVAIYHWIKFVEFGLLGYYIVKTKPSVTRIVYCLLFTVLYSSIVAIGQFFLQHSIGGPLWFLGERTFAIDTPGIARVVFGGKELLRSYGTFPHPNVLGGFLAVVLPLIVNQLTKRRKILYGLTIAFGIIALVLTFSRSAWVVGLIAMFIVHRSSFIAKNGYKIFFPIGVIVVLLLFTIPLFTQLTTDSESVVVRGQLNTAAIAIVRSAPFFGAGLGNFLVALPEFLPSRTIYFLQPVHNIYLLLVSEIGLIGFIGLIWIIRKRMKWSVSLVALLLLGLVDHYPLTLQQGRLLLTLVIALSYRGHR